MRINGLFWGLAALLLALLAAAGCGSENAVEDIAADTDDIMPVEVMEVERNTIERYVELSGNVDSDGHVSVTSQLNSTVEKIEAAVGKRVGKGETLLLLDNEELASQLRRAQAEQEQAEQSFYNSKNIGLPQKLRQAENSVQEAAIEYENARKNLERMKSLYDIEAVSQEELEQVESRFELAQMAYETAQDNLAKERESQERELAILEAQLKSAGEALASARINFEKSILEAPITGTITSVKAKIGQELSPGTPVVTIVDFTSTYVEIKLTERLLAEINEGAAALIEIPGTIQQYQGTVQEIDLTPLEGTKSYPAKVYFTADGHVRIGQSASLQVLAEKAEEVIAVPPGAVLHDNDTASVFVVEEGTARERIVKTGLSSEGKLEILEGLQEGETLVVEGQHFLDDGRQVEIVGGEDR